MTRADRIETSERDSRETPAARNGNPVAESTPWGMAIWAVIIGITVVGFSLAEVFPIMHAHQARVLPQEVRDSVVNLLILAVLGGFYLIVMGTIVLCSPTREEDSTTYTKYHGLRQPGSPGRQDAR